MTPSPPTADEYLLHCGADMAAGDDGEVDDDVAEELDEEVDEVVSDEDEGDFKFGK